MKIAIGTLRKPKVDAIKEGIQSIKELKEKEINYILEKIPSGVSDMPLSLEETMNGAKNRALNLKKKEIEADFYIGIEGGAYKLLNNSYLLGVIYIENSKGEGYFGLSQAITIPKKVEKMLYEEGKELGPVMNELLGKGDLRNNEGAMYAWSNGVFKRKDEFILAFKSAISPFFNEFYKLQ